MVFKPPLGGLLLGSVVPFTLIVIFPTNGTSRLTHQLCTSLHEPVTRTASASATRTSRGPSKASLACAVDAVVFAWLVGGILVSYEALAEAAKYSVPGIGSWIAVELGAGVVQFTLYGALLGWVHRARVPQTE